MAVEEATVAASANHVARVQRAYTHLGFGKVEPVTPLPFHAAADGSEATQNLIDSVKNAMADILALSDDTCVDWLATVNWFRGWDRLLQKCLRQAVTSNRSTNAALTRVIDDFFSDVPLLPGHRRLWT